MHRDRHVQCGTLSNGTAVKMGLGFLNWFFVVNDRYDLKNAEYIVLHGANSVWPASGMPINNYLQAKKAGAKYVVVGPFKNATAHGSIWTMPTSTIRQAATMSSSGQI